MGELDRHDPKELLESGLVPSGPLFEGVLKDRDRLLSEIENERREKRELEEALLRSHQLVGCLQAEIAKTAVEVKQA